MEVKAWVWEEGLPRVSEAFGVYVLDIVSFEVV